MARRNKTNFTATVNAQFPTNGIGSIGAVRVRENLGADVPDSFLNNVDDLQLLVSAAGANAYTLAGAIASYATGFMAIVKIHTTSTGLCTLNVNAIGNRKMYKDQATQASSGDLVAGQIYIVIYDSTLDGAAGGFLVLNYASNGISKRVVLDVSGASPEMNMANQPKRTFVGSAPIAGDKELSFLNDSELVEATTLLEISGNRLITVPANVIRDPSMWIWTKPATKLIWNAAPGLYRLEWKNDGVNIYLDIYGGYNSTL